MKRILFVCLTILLSSQMFAQGNDQNDIFSRFAKWRTSSMKRGCDSSYVQLPKQSWTLKLNGISSFSRFGIYAHDIPGHDNATLKVGSGFGFKSSVSLAYRGLELGYSTDQTNHYDKDMKFGLYSKRIGGEIQYQTFINTNSDLFTGDLPDSVIHYKNDYINRLTLNVYYVLNCKTFSYPAAITQSYIQKKSAGSFLLGASVFHNKIKPFKNGSDLAILYNPTINLVQAAIGGGYGYNFVCLNSQLLIHLSAMPMVLFTLKDRVSGAYLGIPYDENFKNTPTLTVISRASICYTIQDQLIISLNGVYNRTHSNSDSEIYVTSDGFILQFTLGWRFL